MVERVLRLLDVDARQFRAMLAVSLRVDFRTGLFDTGSVKKKRRRLSGLWKILLFYGFLGVILSFTIIESANLFFTAGVMMTITMFAVAMSVLVEFQSVVVSPDDYHLLAHRPITSQTFFVARIANIFVYIGVMTLAIGLVPAIVYSVIDGFKPLLGLSALLGMFGAAILVTMFIVFLYVNLMRVAHPGKLRRFFSYMQLLLSFIVYGSGMIFSTLLNTGVLDDITLKHEAWMLLLPPTWFASLPLLVDGITDAHTIPSILLGLCITAMLLVYAYGKLSFEYAAILSRQSETSEKVKRARPSRATALPMFRHGEGRAAALLIRNQFKYEHKFRMSILAIIPLTVLYLLAGLIGGGGLADPFVDPARHVAKANLLYFAMAFFPVLLMASMTRSDQYRASWIFHATPMDKGKLVLAVKDVLVVFFVFPYVLSLGIIFGFFFESFRNVLIHIFMLGILSHLILQLLVLLNPWLPFSRPVRKGERTAGVFAGIITAAIGMTVVINILARLIYPSALATALALVVLAVLTILFERYAAQRVRKKATLLEFDH